MTRKITTAAPSATREEVAEALGVVWDDGNGTGLDGWVGPGRGAGEVDREAVRARDRAVDRALRVIADAPSATRDEIAGHPIGGGYYATSVGVDEASEIADALLDSLD